jgi:hypothetical protein
MSVIAIMTSTEFTQIAQAIGLTVSGVASVASACLAFIAGRKSDRNARMLGDQATSIENVRATTDGMAERNEAIARKLGLEEGHRQGVEDAKNGKHQLGPVDPVGEKRKQKPAPA